MEVLYKVALKNGLVIDTHSLKFKDGRILFEFKTLNEAFVKMLQTDKEALKG